MKTIELENLISDTILLFLENLAELGCPKDVEPDMWFRELSDEERYKVGEKLLEIIERPPIGEEVKKEQPEEKEAIGSFKILAERDVKMVEMDIDIDDELADKLVECALEEIKNDRGALLNYIINRALKRAVERQGYLEESDSKWSKNRMKMEEDEEYEGP